MRVLLVIAVLAAQSAGPWLCLCGAATTCHAATTDADAPVGCPHCCDNCPPPADNPAPVSPAAPNEPCGCLCHGASFDAVPATPTDRESAGGDFVALLKLDLPVSLPFVAPVADVRPAEPEGLNPLPFLPTAVRLNVHHALRC